VCYEKTLKPVFRSFIATLVFRTALFITACSNEEEITNNNEMLVLQRPANVIDADLEQKVISFYGNVTFTKGRTASTNVNGFYYDCTELIINSDTRARGYIFSEQLAGDFLYIADVDRENYVLRTYDFIRGETYSIFKISDHINYKNSDGLDFIKIINETSQANYQVHGRPMFGGGTSYEYTQCGICTCVWEVHTFYVFWIKFESKEMINLTNCVF